MQAELEIARLVEKLESGDIPSEEPLFVLRGQDQTAAIAVRLWAMRAKELGTPRLKCLEALRLSDDMDQWPVKQVPGCPNTRRLDGVVWEESPMIEALELVVSERIKQLDKWGADHDESHDDGELALAAAGLLRCEHESHDRDMWGLIGKHPVRRDQLVIAIALALAELERISEADVIINERRDLLVRLGVNPETVPDVTSAAAAIVTVMQMSHGAATKKPSGDPVVAGKDLIITSNQVNLACNSMIYPFRYSRFEAVWQAMVPVDNR